MIPGGAHTYSRSADQFPSNAPEILSSGNGAYVYAEDGQVLLDYGMALRSVGIGYAEPDVNYAAIKAVWQGNNLTRPSTIELEAAERFCDLIGCDMVKFTKNGSTSVTAAVKLARAYTGRDVVARCFNHPFFSYDDWFIGSTSRSAGVPRSIKELTVQFIYGDLGQLEKVLSNKDIACVVLEPATTAHPPEGYLQGVRQLCDKYGTVLIFDEMITGFRWHLKGAQHYYGVKPDLSTFGKAMANGFSVSCVCGKRELMQLGARDVFLASTTHGAEMCGLAAFVATVDFMKNNNVTESLWVYGQSLLIVMKSLATHYDLGGHFMAGGVPCSPWYQTFDDKGEVSLAFRTLFMQEMIKSGVLMPWISICYRHGQNELLKTERALHRTFAVYRKALSEGVAKYIEGPVIQPVFK